MCGKRPVTWDFNSDAAHLSPFSSGSAGCRRVIIGGPTSSTFTTIGDGQVKGKGSPCHTTLRLRFLAGGGLTRIP